MVLSLAVVSGRDETQCVGNVYKVSSAPDAELGFQTENLNSGC